MTDIEKVFTNHLSHVEFNRELLSILKSFQLFWLNKNPDHVEFMSGVLLGTHPIRFTIDDDAHFWLDILEVDVAPLREDLHKLKDIYPERNVTSNVFYLTITWLMSKFIKTKLIKHDIEDAIETLYLIFAYKALSSLDSHYFKYSLDRETALVVHENLSLKFQIKKYGSWQKLLVERSKDFQKGGLHYPRLVNYNARDATLILSDAQGRLRDVYKQIWKVLAEVLLDETKHSTSSMVGDDAQGESAIKTIIDRPDQFLFYGKSIVHDPTQFIKRDIVKVTTAVFKNVDVDDVVLGLRYISERSERDKGMLVLVENIIKINIDYLNKTGFRNEYDQSILHVMNTLKGLWSRNRVKSKELAKTKKELTKVIKRGTKIVTEWRLGTVVLNVVIYIFIRTVLKDKMER